MALRLLTVSLLACSVHRALCQREDIVAGAIIAQAADSFGTILDGKQQVLLLHAIQYRPAVPAAQLRRPVKRQGLT